MSENIILKKITESTPHTPEGTAVKSTGEAGATKFLREDGDGTCSWQEGGGNPAGSEGEIQFNESSAFQADSNLFWDNVNKRLGIGVIPNNKLQVAGLINFDDTNFNVFLGTDVFTNDSGQFNVGVGYQAGYYNDTTGADDYGDYNTYVGYQAGRGDAGGNTGHYNVGIGYQTLYSNTNLSGRYNTAIGYQTLYSNTTGRHNTAIGSFALTLNTWGYENVGIGYNALQGNTSGQRNVGIGYNALQGNTSGKFNFALGYGALITNTSGESNVALGYSALQRNTIGDNNLAIGARALNRNVGSGHDNVAFGNNALYWNISGNNNVAVGASAGKSNETGNNNLSLGNYAGFYQTGSNRLVIDNQDRGSAAAEITDALMYGVFNATPASQSLRFNVGSTTFHNATHEDSDGGRSNKLNFKGQQGVDPFEETTLARIEVSHDGTGEDDKGKLVISTNDGNDGDTPTTAVTIDSGQNVFLHVIKSGATQGGAGAAANELWKTSSHATLPDNVVMIGV